MIITSKGMTTNQAKSLLADQIWQALQEIAKRETVNLTWSKSRSVNRGWYKSVMVTIGNDKPIHYQA